MSLPNRILILTGTLCALGLVLRVLGAERGLDIITMALLIAVLSVAPIERAAPHDQATFRRKSLGRPQSPTK